MSTFDLSTVIAALSSCAIESNELAIELLELSRKDWEEFVKRIKGMGLVKEE